VLTALAADHPGASTVHYNRACCEALLGQPEAALASLAKAVDTGWWNDAHTARDPDLTSLRELPAFAALRERIRATPPPARPPPSLAWQTPPAAAGQPRARLAMVLAVTGGRGEAVDLAGIRLALTAAADGSRPDGTVYLMNSTDEARSGPRRWAFAAAATALAAEGVAAEVLPGILPPAKARVVGVTAGIADFDWAASGATLVAGAWGDHLTSLAGVLRPHGGQTPLTAWLAAGAAGSAGTVTEPLNYQAKFPTAFLHLHRARGLTLAEALWRSVAAPYQLLAVGDPLSSPWARPPALTVSPDPAKPDVFRCQALGAPAARVPLGTVEVFLDGRRLLTAAPGAIAVPLSGLPAGAHELRVVGIAADAQAATARWSTTITRPGPAATLALPETAAWATPIAVTAACPGATRLRLMHLGRCVTEAAGATAELRLDSRALGLGRAQVWLEAATADGRQLARSPAQVVEVAAPRLLPGRATPPDVTPGAILSPDGGTPHRLTGPTTGDWLGASGGTIDGWYEVREPGLHQWQWIGNRLAAWSCDDEVPVAAVPGGTAPVVLGAGWHRLRITVKPGKTPFELRFGRQGTAPLTPEQWRGDAAGPAAPAAPAQR
jgi:hypothetical protein